MSKSRRPNQDEDYGYTSTSSSDESDEQDVKRSEVGLILIFGNRIFSEVKTYDTRSKSTAWLKQMANASATLDEISTRVSQSTAASMTLQEREFHAASKEILDGRGKDRMWRLVARLIAQMPSRPHYNGMDNSAIRLSPVLDGIKVARSLLFEQQGRAESRESVFESMLNARSETIVTAYRGNAVNAYYIMSGLRHCLDGLRGERFLRPDNAALLMTLLDILLIPFVQYAARLLIDVVELQLINSEGWTFSFLQRVTMTLGYVWHLIHLVGDSAMVQRPVRNDGLLWQAISKDLVHGIWTALKSKAIPSISVPADQINQWTLFQREVELLFLHSEGSLAEVMDARDTEVMQPSTLQALITWRIEARDSFNVVDLGHQLFASSDDEDSDSLHQTDRAGQRPPKQMRPLEKDDHPSMPGIALQSLSSTRRWAQYQTLVYENI